MEGIKDEYEVKEAASNDHVFCTVFSIDFCLEVEQRVSYNMILLDSKTCEAELRMR